MRVKNKKHIMRTKQIYIGIVVLMLGVFAVGAARAQPQQQKLPIKIPLALYKFAYN